MSALQQSLGQQLASELKRLHTHIAALDSRSDPESQVAREAAVAETYACFKKVFGDKAFVERIQHAVVHWGICRDKPAPTLQEFVTPAVSLRVNPCDIEQVVDAFAEVSSAPPSEKTQWALWRIVRVTRPANQGPSHRAQT